MTSPTDVSSAKGGLAVTPGTGELPGGPTRGLWVGGAGNLDVVFENGTAATISGVGAGTLLPISVRKVLASSTATLILALY